MLVANKVDGEKAMRHSGEFARLGFGTPVGVSASNVIGIWISCSMKCGRISIWRTALTEIQDPQMHLAIVGKPYRGQEHAGERDRRAIRRRSASRDRVGSAGHDSRQR